MNLIETLEREAIDALTKDKPVPEFRPGDTLRVGVKVIEGDRTRVQNFEGVCIARANKGVGSSFTVRKISFGEGVERVFPLYSPIIDKIEVVRRGDVRRAKLYYLRGRTGKAARIAERRDVRRDVPGGKGAATGAQRMLVDSQKIGTGGAISEEEKMRRERARIAGTKGITEYVWAPDSRSILVPIDGDLYLATLDGNVRRLTNTAATEIDPKMSETGRYLSFLRDRNLFVMDQTTGRERALTSDGGGTLSWGAAEFVAQRESG